MTIMTNDKMMAQISGRDGFIAALDQSGGSTPGALRLYGIPDNAYNGDAEMFRLVHEMRVRIMTAPAFTGAKVIATILFEGTMDGEVQGKPTPSFLWEDRGGLAFHFTMLAISERQPFQKVMPLQCRRSGIGGL